LATVTRTGVLLLLQGCLVPVMATGTLEAHPDAVWIRASNDKARPLKLDEASAPLARADGLLVELEGTLRHGAIDVERWRIVEGPHGMQAWVGRVVVDPTGRLALEVPDNGTWRLRGPLLDALGGAEGGIVLVEGMVDGPMTIQALDWRPLS
jgi:hypothetical protein